MPNGNDDKWAQYAEPAGGSDKWAQYETTEPAKTNEPSTYQKLTAGYNPGVEALAEHHPAIGPALRFLDSVGGAAITAANPYEWARGMKFLAQSYLDQQNGPLQKSVSDALDEWANNPNVRKAAPSLLPEALGQGVGNIAGGAVAPSVAKGIGKGTTAARQAIGGAIRTPEGTLTPGAKVASQLGGAAIGGGVGEMVHPGYGLYAGAGAGYKAGPVIVEKMFPAPPAAPSPPEFPGASLPAADEFYANRGAELNAIRKMQTPKGKMTPPPVSPFAPTATSSAMPIGNAPLPEVPQGAPTPFPTVQPKVKAAAAGVEAPAAPNGESGIPTFGKTLYQMGEEPNLTNPQHVKILKVLQTRSGSDLRALANQGDRFAAFVLRTMPRP